MKTKRQNIIFAIATIALFALAACSGCVTPSTQKLTPAQLAAQVCPVVNPAFTTLQLMPGLPPSGAADLEKVAPVVAAVCSATATVDATSLQTLANTAIPAVISVIKTTTLSVDDQNKIIFDITASQFLINAVLAAQAGNVAPAPSTTTAPATAVKP